MRGSSTGPYEITFKLPDSYSPNATQHAFHSMKESSSLLFFVISFLADTLAAACTRSSIHCQLLGSALDRTLHDLFDLSIISPYRPGIVRAYRKLTPHRSDLKIVHLDKP